MSYGAINTHFLIRSDLRAVGSLWRILLKSLVPAANHSNCSTHCCSRGRSFSRIPRRLHLRSLQAQRHGRRLLRHDAAVVDIRAAAADILSREPDLNRCLRNSFARDKSSRINRGTT